MSPGEISGRPGWSFVKRAFSRKRRYRRFVRPSTLIAVFLIFFLISASQWILPIYPPLPDFDEPTSCHEADGYILEDKGICMNTCGDLCFPRVHGICFHHSEVVLCDGQLPFPQHVVDASGGLPLEMRFDMEKPRMKVPVVYKVCPGWNASTLIASDDTNSARWIRGLQMVADLSFMPIGNVGPNPHHEAEKVIPAIIFSQLTEFQDSQLFWFADPIDPLMISKWTLGLLNVFSEDLKVKYVQPVAKGEEPLCFEDAILFSGITNSGYIPNTQTHDWLRNRILKHCDIPVMTANRPIQNVVMVHRTNSSRNLKNFDVVKSFLEEELQTPVKMAIPGPWPFCDQVKVVAEADVVLTPHGSHNVNLLAVRPGATIFELFPLLYYVDWYKHYLHAGRVNFYEVFGTWPMEKSSMPFQMRVFALFYGWKKCFSAKRCMNYGKKQGIYLDLEHFSSQLQTSISKCHITALRSSCIKKID